MAEQHSIVCGVNDHPEHGFLGGSWDLFHEGTDVYSLSKEFLRPA